MLIAVVDEPLSKASLGMARVTKTDHTVLESLQMDHPISLVGVRSVVLASFVGMG